MSYAASITYLPPVNIDGKRVFVVRIAETEAAPASEATIDGSKIPRIGTITSYRATLTAGTGATIQPALGRKAAFTASTQEHIGSQASAAAHIRDISGIRYNLGSQDNLIVRSTPNNAAADHTIGTELVITEGH